MMFYGSCAEKFDGIPKEVTGGDLEFTAYLMWNPKIVPKEHRGVLVRIFGASGTLFDSTFLKYPVNEYTRLSQTTCEIFVNKGLEGALNIDRESFNTSHPHVVFLTRWLHGALRQLMNVNKGLSSKLRKGVRERFSSSEVSRIEKIADDFWKEVKSDDSSLPPKVIFQDHDVSSLDAENNNDFVVSDHYRFSKKNIFSESNGVNDVALAKLSTIVKLLASYDLLDGIPKSSQERLIKEIREVLEA
jgi:hypothetical protein